MGILNVTPDSFSDGGVHDDVERARARTLEMIAEGERAVAGGGRYDNLIELFGGPPTPAVGFGMGDVVLGLLLQDKGLMPDSVEAVPDVFIIASSDTAAAQVPGLATKLRQQGIHARFSYKTTRNVGKLLKDAATCNARFAVIVEDSGLQLKDLTSGEQAEVSPKDLADRVLTSRNAV